MATKTEPKKDKETPLTSLAEIQALAIQKQKCVFEFKGKSCELEVRSLTPAEEAAVAAIVEAVIPEVVKGPTPEQDRAKVNDAGFVKARAEAALKARAQAVYWAVPALRDAKPGLTDTGDIVQYIQGQLTESVIDMLWQATRKGGISLAELVNFT